jgi:hypothetical protein
MQRRGCKKAFLLIHFTKELEPHLRECGVLLDESHAGLPTEGQLSTFASPSGTRMSLRHPKTGLSVR